jgi:type IV secretory pathway protease TraF
VALEDGGAEARLLAFNGVSPVTVFAGVTLDLSFTVSGVGQAVPQGTPVQFALSGSGSVLSADHAPTDPLGVATAQLTAGTAPGDLVLTASTERAPSVRVSLHIRTQPYGGVRVAVTSRPGVSVVRADIAVFVFGLGAIPMTCAELTSSLTLPGALFTFSLPVVPGEHVFSPVPSESTALALAKGYGATGDLVARGCAERAIVTEGQTPTLNLALEQLPWAEMGRSATGGGLSSSAGRSSLASLALDALGFPVVAWREEAPAGYQNRIYLKRWNGSAWVELGGSASGGGVSDTDNCVSPAVAFDGNGNPVVAWEAYNPVSENEEIYLKRWSGTAWEELGGSATGGGVSKSPSNHSYRPSLVVDKSGNPVVAWAEKIDTGYHEIYLKRWNGNSWEEIGGSASGGGVSNTPYAMSLAPSLAVDSSGNPVVAWAEYFSGWQIYLRRWNAIGGGWVEVGGSASGPGLSDSEGSCSVPSLALDAAGTPFVAWQESRGEGNIQISLKRWDPGTQSWVGLGGSELPGGVNQSPASGIHPSLVVDPSGRPLVAWEEMMALGVSEIYVKRWTGTAWVEFGGSATGGGVSESPEYCLMPSLAVDASGRPFVAWEDQATTEIYLKRYTQ